MSHFSVAVFTKPEGKSIEELLAPYDETTPVERYVKYTKAELIEKSKKEIADYAATGPYSKYLADPEKYKSECRNEAHLTYLESGFPERLQWTDEEHYQNETRWYEDGEIGPDGEVYSTYNPKSKWDWYMVGGRWSGKLNGADSAKVCDIRFEPDFSTFAVILPDGEWCEKGNMGWWGFVSDEKEEWEQKYKKAFLDTADPSWTLTIVDCHI